MSQSTYLFICKYTSIAKEKIVIANKIYIYIFMYIKETIFNKNTWNNAFSYDKRKELLGNAEITIPSIKTINSIDQIELGNHIVFEEIDHKGKLCSCKGLQHIYHLSQYSDLHAQIYIFDNHNHALYLRTQHMINHRTPLLLEEGLEVRVLHIDQHSDLTPPPLSMQDYAKKQWISSDVTLFSSDFICNYTNDQCNVGNFILPFLDIYPQTQFERIKSESQLLSLNAQFLDLNTQCCIVDIDLDFRAPEMSIQQYTKTLEKTKELIKKAKLITIATSPYFLDQHLALKILNDIFR